MKKFLLSLAAVACAASMSAASYTVFDIENPGTWTGGDNGWACTQTFSGVTFNLSTAKASSTTNLISPAANTNSWRVYKGSTFTIEATGFTMKTIVITYDNYEYNGTTYYGELVLGNGWTGVLDETEYTLVNANGSTTFTGQASAKQVRIKTIVVSDTNDIGTPEQPALPEGMLYKQSFATDMAGWEVVNDESVGDFQGWKINTQYGCALANAYWDGGNHAAVSKLQKTFNLKDCTGVSMSFEGAYGYDHPAAQTDNYRVYVTADGYTDYLTMSNFPADKSSTYTDFVTNTFDLAEYDDNTAVTIGFEYSTDGSTSRAWEIKNFVLYGKGQLGGVDGVTVEENAAPVYYNLQGVRVNAPEKGINIVVKGNKAEKVIF